MKECNYFGMKITKDGSCTRENGTGSSHPRPHLNNRRHFSQ